MPRIVAQTVEVVRNVIRIEDGKIVAELPEQGNGGVEPISEQVFYETLAKIDPKTSHDLRMFLDRAKERDLSVEPGSDSLQLKFILSDVELNLGVFKKNGSFRNSRMADVTEELGYPEIGENYLTELASLFTGGFVDKRSKKFRWTVKKGNNQTTVTIAEVLAVQNKWLEIIQSTIDQLLKAQEKLD